MNGPLLTRPVRFRELTLRNRIVISPMCMYHVEDGVVGDFHLVHLGRFAMGGAGLVIAEATAVSAIGRITHGCPGLWKDSQIDGFRRITDFIHAEGAAAGIQLAHAGAKASAHKPWEGALALGADEGAWPAIGVTGEPWDAGWPSPHRLDEAGMTLVTNQYVEAARRAEAAGFDVVEVHAAHGYLLHSFLSPLTNTRSDAYGGELAGRMRFPLRVIAAIRAAWPAEKPLFVRISSVDGIDLGWSAADSITFARELRAIGVDVVDCSSGGMKLPTGRQLVQRTPGYHVPYAEAVRRDAGIATIAVGLICDPELAESILQKGQADLVAIAREALFNPNWPLTAGVELEGVAGWDRWPVQFGLRLKLRAQQSLPGRPGKSS